MGAGGKTTRMIKMTRRSCLRTGAARKAFGAVVVLFVFGAFVIVAQLICIV